jgi:alpha-glucosidase
MTLMGRARTRVTGECSAFAPRPGARAWIQRFHRAYELPYAPMLLRDAPPGFYAYPVLLELDRGWLLLTESGVPRGQPATHLEVRAGLREVLNVLRPHEQPGLEATRSPWRVAVIGPLARIVESDLVDDLARPARTGPSWVRPGRVAWSWWSDSASPASLARQQQYVDFAARMGWEYVLVDAGWDPAWMPALTAYARRRGVRVLVWARWDALRPPSRRDALLAQWRAWGVAGVKLDFMDSDSYQRMRWYRGVARAAARRHLVVNFHGSTAPRGMERTWPNVLTSEGVVGAESYKGDLPVQANPVDNTILPFTRNAIGSMDYTPVTFSTPRRRTSDAHELALSVVFESGLQHFADSPESYAARPAARRWLRRVPAAWDDTRFLRGYPGASATIARRAGRRWYVGSIDAGAGGRQRLPLRFLFPGRRYLARIVEDAPGGGLATRTRHVTARRVLHLRTGPAGGYAVRFKPVARRRR